VEEPHAAAPGGAKGAGARGKSAPQGGLIQAARRAVVAFLLLLLWGCAPERGATCLLADARPMIVVELFFGRDIPGRAPLTDAEWDGFAATDITPRFPDGLTMFDGDGQWRVPETGAIMREKAKIVLAAVAPSSDLESRIDAVRQAYRRNFHQQLVGVITAPGCGAF
jgi:hypothetical protein